MAITRSRPNPLVPILRDAATHGVSIDLQGFDFTRGLKPRDVALLRAKAQKLSAFRIDQTRWVVSSGTEAAYGYIVFRYRDGHYVCNCAAGNAGRLCKHVVLVESLIPAEPAPQAQPQSEQTPKPGSKLRGTIKEIWG
jgi:hypothetical protein